MQTHFERRNEKGEMRKTMRMIIPAGDYLLKPSRLLVPCLLVN